MKKLEITELLNRLIEAVELRDRAFAQGQAQDWAEAEISIVKRLIIKAVVKERTL